MLNYRNKTFFIVVAQHYQLNNSSLLLGMNKGGLAMQHVVSTEFGDDECSSDNYATCTEHAFQISV